MSCQRLAIIYWTWKSRLPDQRSLPRARRWRTIPPTAMPSRTAIMLCWRDDVQGQVALFLFPVELAGHAPQNIHPEGGHRPADHHEPHVVLRRMDGAVDKHVGGNGQEGQEDLEKDPGLFSLLADHARICAADDGLQEQTPAAVLMANGEESSGSSGSSAASSILWPTRLTKTSSRVGSCFCRLRMRILLRRQAC